VDIICCAKILAKNLSSSSSCCISFGGQIFTPCEFEHHVGKSTYRKLSICCCRKPLSTFIKSHETTDGNKGCRFVVSEYHYVPPDPSVTSPPQQDAHIKLFDVSVLLILLVDNSNSLVGDKFCSYLTVSIHVYLA